MSDEPRSKAIIKTAALERLRKRLNLSASKIATVAKSGIHHGRSQL